jgi:hypothetical protein
MLTLPYHLHMEYISHFWDRPVPYFCVLREGYYVIIWLIVRICVFIKDWKLIYSELFILKRKSMDNWGESWHKLHSMHLPVKRTWFFLKYKLITGSKYITVICWHYRITCTWSIFLTFEIDQFLFLAMWDFLILH